MAAPKRAYWVSWILIAGLAAAAAIVPIGCGDKISLPSDLPAPIYGGIDTSYVQVFPEWTAANGVNFSHPQDVYIGYDQTIYICDTDNHRVVNLDLAGNLIGVYPMKHPVAITQDHGLDLLVVCGDYFEVLPGGNQDTVKYGNAVFRRSHRNGGGFVKVFQTDSPYHSIPVRDTTFFVDAEFYGISASPLDSKFYYLADRYKGRIIEFGANDAPRRVHLSQGVGLGLTDFPTDLTTYTIAGQSYVALAQGVGNIAVQLFSLPDFVPLYNENDSLPALIRFTARAYKDIAVDELSNYYMILRETDELLGANAYFYKFDRRGELLLTFGTTGSGNRQFRNPNGIACFEGVIYIADTGNNRIVRYQLSTDSRQ